MVLAFTTVTYNDRATLPRVISAVLATTEFPEGTKWYFILQNCQSTFCDNIVQLCKGKIEAVLICFANNIGLSKSMAFVIEQTKYFDYILNVEDDWQALATHVPNKQWLLTSLRFLEEQKNVSIIFLRAYSGDAEKFQYGFTRVIPYVCHKHKDNFNYQAKLETAEKIKYAENITYVHIENMLFTFNPALFRNSDLHKYVCPIPIFDLDSKAKGNNANWGGCEAYLMERTRDLKSMWLNEGVFGHLEDFIKMGLLKE